MVKKWFKPKGRSMVLVEEDEIEMIIKGKTKSKKKKIVKEEE